MTTLKEDLKQLENYVRAVSEHWKWPMYTTLRVLVGNMASSGHLEPTAMKVIEELRKVRPNDHVLEFVGDELIILDEAAYHEEHDDYKNNQFLSPDYKPENA